MPKRAEPDETIDPVRSRLAAAAAAPIAPQRVTTARQPGPVEKHPVQGEQGGREGNGRPDAPPRSLSAGRPRVLTVNRKVMVTPDEAQRIEETTALISSAFGSKVTYSQVSRALWSLLAGAEDAIRAGSRRAPRLSVPSKGNHIAMAEYEEALADFLITAMKRS